MKQSSLSVIVIPLVIVGLVIAGAVVYKNMYSPSATASPSVPQTTSSVPSLDGDAGKPSSGFVTSTDPSRSESVSDLSKELESTQMDDVGGDFSALESEANGL